MQMVWAPVCRIAVDGDLKGAVRLHLNVAIGKQSELATHIAMSRCLCLENWVSWRTAGELETELRRRMRRDLAVDFVAQTAIEHCAAIDVIRIVPGNA